MKINRDWATPLTIGAFALMAVTGVLMFFHLDSDLNKLAHEWLSWVMLVGVALHASVNWPAFRRHLLNNRIARPILAVSVLLTAGSFAPLPGGDRRNGSPPMMALRAVMAAPLSSVAPLTGRSLDALQDELGQAGFSLKPDQPLDSVTGGDLGREAQLLSVLFKGITPDGTRP
jgi:hypothetical protein